MVDTDYKRGRFGALFFGLPPGWINNSMTTTTAIDRQPTKFDYASPTQFKFQLTKLPKVEYFTTACNIPGISLSSALQPTPLKDIPIPGDTVEFNDLEITFLVDENLENYREIHGWLRGLGFPGDHKEHANLLKSGNTRFPGSTSNILGDAGRSKYAPPKTPNSIIFFGVNSGFFFISTLFACISLSTNSIIPIGASSP